MIKAICPWLSVYSLSAVTADLVCAVSQRVKTFTAAAAVAGEREREAMK
jgi:hypothetical protein